MVAEREDEVGVQNAEAVPEAEVEHKERWWVDAEACDMKVGDAGNGGKQVEKEGEVPKEREEMEEWEIPGGAAMEAGAR